MSTAQCNKDEALGKKVVDVIRLFSEHRAKVLSVLLFIVILMNSARYFLKFGTPSSSPGYTDTPVEFWAIRYFLIGLVFLVLASYWRRFRLFELMAFVVLALSSLYALSIAESASVKIAAFHLCLASFLFFTARSMEDEIATHFVGLFTKLLYALAVCFAAFLALQIFLYFATDVLPSHSHANSILVRFGSILDDSLAFGVLLPMFAGLLFYSQEDGFFRSVSLMAVILIAVLTGSLTAMATTAIYTLWLVRLQWRNVALWVLLISLLLASFHWYFIELWSAKSGSIAGHLEGVQLLLGNPEAKLLGNPEAKLQSGGFAESGWILLFKNFGIFALIVMLAFHLYIHLLCSRTLRSAYGNKQYIGSVEGLNFSAFVASFNLPVLMIFPVYFLLAIFSAVLCGVVVKNGIGLKS